MPPGEEMFKFHGLSGPCPKPPLPAPEPSPEAQGLIRYGSYYLHPKQLIGLLEAAGAENDRLKTQNEALEAEIERLNGRVPEKAP